MPNFIRSHTVVALAALALAFTLPVPAAYATGSGSGSGSASGNQAAQAPTQFKPEQIITFAKQVEHTLAERGARVALLARVGRPEADMPEGMKYTHVAFAVYSEITLSDGRKVPGYAIHNLYQKDDAPQVSELVQDFPVDFFAGVAALEAGIVVPSPELQERLLAVIASPTYQKLHEPQYSLIANPYTRGRQNCTEFVLDVVQAALLQTADSEVIKADLKKRFTAQPVKVNPFRLVFGAMFSPEVSLADQPTSPAVTATFERIADYLAKADPGSTTQIIRPN